MTYPRRLLVPPGQAGTYHCVSRCVRRAYLCGRDRFTGRSYEHRKGWLEHRLFHLARCFAVDVYGFAVMDNHLHVVVHVDPNIVNTWSDREVARRWVRVWRPRAGAQARRRAEDALAHDSARLEAVRVRLGSLSWFMRCLKEPIARRANKEDECTGRFWEGRFKVQALLDDAAIISTLVYVDLNPFRAGVVANPLESAYTSARHRSVRSARRRLRPIEGSVRSRLLDLSEAEYLELILATSTLTTNMTGLRRRASPLPRCIQSLGFDARTWRYQVLATESTYYRVIGRAEAMRARALECGQRWFKGVAFSGRLALTGSTAESS